MANVSLHLALALGATLFSVGCGASVFANSNGYDSQSCAENALRRDAPPGLKDQAVALFKERCIAEDGGACSALGVAYESGVVGAPNPDAAEVLYQRACDLENTRGCTNLALLHLHTHVGDAAVAAATRATLVKTCDANDRLACAKLAGMMRDGLGGPTNAGDALDLLDKACDAGETSACVDLAQAVGKASPERAADLYVRACTAGNADACAALDPRADSNGHLGSVASR